MLPRPSFLLAALVLALPGPAALAAEAAVCSQPTYDTTPKVVTPKIETAKEGLQDKVFIEADEANLEKDGISKLLGGVKLRQGDKEFSADKLDFDNDEQTIAVNTQSVFSNAELIIKSQQANFDLNDNSGVFHDTDFVLPTRGARGTSREIAVNADGTAELKITSYTTCAPGSDAWYLLASDIKLDRDEGLGTARNARLRFEGVPVLYIPWFQFPIDQRRRTGLLFPTVGESDKTGFEARWPVYFNLGPNYDATLTPRFMSRRGTQFIGNGRYLLENGEGSASYEYLNNDKVTGEDRALGRFDHVGLLGRNLGLEATYAEASDPRYFEDLGGTFASSAITNLERSARLTYQAPASYRVQVLVQSFQTIDNSLVAVDDPYKRLPQIRFDALTRHAWLDTRAGLNAEAVNFVRDENSVEGQRYDLQPYLRFLKDENAWYFTAQTDWRYTAYRLTDLSAGGPDEPSRSLPVLSAESGLRFERVTGSGAIQTLEPRAFALYVPYENQDRLPLFDTGEPDFDFTQLFARNRFFGEDRISDAQNLAGALTTRLIDPDTGDTRWSASFGQLYRVREARVDLPGIDPPDRGATDFIGEVTYNFLRTWTAATTAQWSPTDSELERTNVSLRYRDLPGGKRFDVAYRDRRGILEQTDASFALPITDAWHVGARNRYSIRDHRTLENFVGVSYETCCWAVSGAYRRYIASSDGELNSGIYFQLQLKGLASIGTDFNSLLPADDGDDESTPGALGSGAGSGAGNGGRHGSVY